MVKWTKGSNKAKDNKDSEERFTGGKDGLSWLEYDALINDWLLENYGARFGEQIWHDKMIDLLTLDLNNHKGEHEYEACKSMVQDVLTENAPKVAEITTKNKKFDTVKWHMQWRARQHEHLYLQLKKTTEGEAQRMVQEAGYKGMSGIRNKLMVRFAQIQSSQLKFRQKECMLGMPSAPGAPMFPNGCNMEKRRFLMSLRRRRSTSTTCVPAMKETQILAHAPHALSYTHHTRPYHTS